MAKGFFIVCLVFACLGCGRKEIAEKFPQGQSKVIREYSFFGSKDSLHLKKEKAFFFNGKTEYEVEYRKGKRHGTYSGYWQNGQIEAKGNYLHGFREGDWEFYFNEFTLSSKGKFQRDLPEGEWTEYWENGELKRRGKFIKGKEVGEWFGWNRKGAEILKTSCFEANALGHFRSSHDMGAIREEYDCRGKVRVGIYTENHDDGSIKTRGFYDTLGNKDSLWESFHLNGNPASKQKFSKGLWSDSVLGWNETGRTIENGFFIRGTGILTRFDSIGHVLETIPMDSGREHGEHWKYYAGKLKRQVIRFNQGKPLSLNRWHPNGKLTGKGQYSNGKKTGFWQEWDSKGTLVESAQYEEGNYHGERRFFDSKGILIRVQKYFRGMPYEGTFPTIPGGFKTSGMKSKKAATN